VACGGLPGRLFEEIVNVADLLKSSADVARSRVSKPSWPKTALQSKVVVHRYARREPRKSRARIRPGTPCLRILGESSDPTLSSSDIGRHKRTEGQCWARYQSPSRRPLVQNRVRRARMKGEDLGLTCAGELPFGYPLAGQPPGTLARAPRVFRWHLSTIRSYNQCAVCTTAAWDAVRTPILRLA